MAGRDRGNTEGPEHLPRLLQERRREEGDLGRDRRGRQPSLTAPKLQEIKHGEFASDLARERPGST
jgi:hypothetical protein